MRLAIAGMIVASSTAFAAPGPLADVHAKLDCAQCHDDGNTASSPAKCLSCHPAIETSRLHVSPLVAHTTCGGCHVDHRGGSADISGWVAIGGTGTFEHGAIGYPLVGVHALATCQKCHSTRDATGATRYTDLTQVCSSCHNSPHAGKPFFDRDCGTCHSPMSRSFATTSVDHGAFPLGKHVAPKVGCDGCHTVARGSGRADITCERCHATVSRHGERFKDRACNDCHRIGTSWSPQGFNHSRTKFQLSFRHGELACRACHRGRDPADFERFPADTKCKGCHAHRTVHADSDHPLGRYTDAQCLQCHMTHGPSPRHPIVDMAHGINGTYPLVKGHKAVPCASCHDTRNAKGKVSFEHVETNCNGKNCHEGDPHGGKLDPKCESCHFPGTWEALKFDHDKPFRSGWSFPLRGMHKTQACDACHANRDFAAAPVACVGCHAGDDAHRGSLGNQCEQCHRDSGEVTFDHDRARFKLVGKHKAVACADCHPNGELKPRPTDCVGCHPVPAFHRKARSELAWYDDDCGGCHSARRW